MDLLQNNTINALVCHCNNSGHNSDLDKKYE